MRGRATTPELPGVAQVTELSAPPATARPAETQGTLALDLAPRESPATRTDLCLADERQEELERFTRRFCLALVEVLGGARGPSQLLRWVTPPVYEGLVNRARALALAGGSDQQLRRARARMRSLHVTCPSPGTAEFSVHVRHGERSRAVAGRLEVRHDSWTCVALQFC